MNTNAPYERKPPQRGSTPSPASLPEMIRELTRVYQDVGLSFPLAHQAALADLEGDLAAVALVA